MCIINRLVYKMTDQQLDTTTKKFDTKNILVIVLSIVLLAFVALFLFQRHNQKIMVNELNREKDSIRVELEHLVVNYDSLKTNNDVLNNNLLITQSQIKNLIVEIEQVKKASYREISDYQSKVTTLRSVMKSLYNQIDSLHERNQILYAENQEVKLKYSEEVDKNEQLEKDKAKLEQTVKQAQIIEAIDLRATGLNPRDKETDKVARSQKIMISFTLSKNLTAKRGPKNIYVRVMRPDQLLLIQSENDLFRFEDLQIPYTAMREVNYEGLELPINIYWDNTGKEQLMPGTYTIDVFADGYNIGTTTYVMRQ